MIRARSEWIVRKRDGRLVGFEPTLISRAISNAFRAEMNLVENQPLGSELDQEILAITDEVARGIESDASTDGGAGVELVQDIVELQLMKRGHYRVARRYIVYRAEHAKIRSLQATETIEDESRPEMPRLHVKLEDGVRVPFDSSRIRRRLDAACKGLSECDSDALLQEVMKSVFDGISVQEIYRAMILAARCRIEQDPAYDTVAARLLQMVISNDALGSAPLDADDYARLYRNQFEHYVIDGIVADRLTPDLRRFDLTQIATALKPQRDTLFKYPGLQAVYDRYLLHIDGRRIETPQYFWMRVAMGLALNEDDPEARAVEFYEILSSMRFTSATPTLFNSATNHPQLSSCYLSTVKDDLEHIFKCVSDNAKLSKWAGGLGNDWTEIRATNAHIKGTNGRSQGVIPFLKVVNDSVAAVNQGGRRKGAACIYLETWHADIEEFLQLRDNTGDEAQRTHNLNLANWVPDLFMERVESDQMWSLFDPKAVPYFVDTYGEEFRKAYLKAETEGLFTKQVKARDLYSRMMKTLAQTGNGWMTFKDAANSKANQTLRPENVIHLSNLCTEILEVTSNKETAVCNLGSVNLSQHIQDGKFDFKKLGRTVEVAVKYLDRVIDINFYPIGTASSSNSKWRPVGLGVMGLQDVFFKLGLPFDSKEAQMLSTKIQEEIYYHALRTSVSLAEKYGPHAAFQDTRAAEGQLQFDLWNVVPEDMERWEKLRRQIKKTGLRNSLIIAIAPTATIASIVGSYEAIEPQISNLFKRETLSGEFIQINRYLVDALKKRNLWTEEIRNKIKAAEGSIQDIQEIPEDIRRTFRTVWEIPQKSLIDMAAKRGPYVDQAQSLNLFLESP
ncbi:MAG: ribonucleoside-diphosphate reductase subunit alpha, partial [Planctomycetaceae bacterium]|nr:ribonucleoside-diphosphate reductase subunit alpha [Planctomycetaceae bacterium]